MNTCPISTLKTHSSGLKYAPLLMANGRFQLKNESGQVLIGYRGNAYNFLNAENALSWLRDNLSRFKNSGRERPYDFIVKLNKIYSETRAPELLTELQDITDYANGLWDVVEEVDQTKINWDLLDVDGGDAYTVFN